MTSDLNRMTIADARDALRKGDVTSLELTEACLGAIEGAGALGAFVHHTRTSRGSRRGRRMRG